MKAYLYRSICLLLLIASINGFKSCDQVKSHDKDRCLAAMQRWHELKDEFLKKCCSEITASISENDCKNVCTKSAIREATEKLISELRADRTMSQTDLKPQMPVPNEDRVSFGPNRSQFRIFKRINHSTT